MNATMDVKYEILRLQVEVSQLRQQLSGAYSEYVEGWNNAARFLGVSDRTCQARHQAGEFPAPVRSETYVRAGKTCTKPVWRRSDLRRYAEGGKVAEFAQMRTHLQ